ncbi:hypothetical protein [Moorena bouillonii]|uniref:Uncharacterized protein n=1 Tax=Moorena bouillonii PNG TaxID=568701 RepID=A0A1U7N6L4_9CYAN|nr:hypothetical protein [Moorena bouillonii]OLT61544.1 hypothetical protein BJP37_23560 [Moorena bouillonii PNG]
MKVESYQTSFEASTISPSQLQTLAKRPLYANNLQPSTFNLQPSTFNLQPFNLQPFNLQPWPLATLREQTFKARSEK